MVQHHHDSQPLRSLPTHTATGVNWTKGLQVPKTQEPDAQEKSRQGPLLTLPARVGNSADVHRHPPCLSLHPSLLRRGSPSRCNLIAGRILLRGITRRVAILHAVFAVSMSI